MPRGILRAGLRPLAGACVCASAAAAAPAAMPVAKVPVMKLRLFSIFLSLALSAFGGCCAKKMGLERGLPAAVAEMGGVKRPGLGPDIRAQFQAQRARGR